MSMLAKTQRPVTQDFVWSVQESSEENLHVQMNHCLNTAAYWVKRGNQRLDAGKYKLGHDCYLEARNWTLKYNLILDELTKRARLQAALFNQG